MSLLIIIIRTIHIFDSLVWYTETWWALTPLPLHYLIFSDKSNKSEICHSSHTVCTLVVLYGNRVSLRAVYDTPTTAQQRVAKISYITVPNICHKITFYQFILCGLLIIIKILTALKTCTHIIPKYMSYTHFSIPYCALPNLGDCTFCAWVR